MNKKLKQILIAVVIALVSVSCGDSTEETPVNNEPSYNIKVNINSLDNGLAYLSKWKDGEFVKLDSAVIDSGAFSFKGKVDFPSLQYILFDNSDDRVLLFVENSTISVSGATVKRESLTVSGSAAHDQFTDFMGKTEEYNAKLQAITGEYYAAQEKGDKELVKAVEEKYALEDSIKVVFIEDYIKSNLNSVIAPYLSLMYMMGKDVEELDELNKSFSDSIRGSEYVQQFEDNLRIIKSTAIGQPAPTFEMNDRDGNPMTLESFKGSYVLVDFWASWCGPCRVENPNVLAAYNKYHTKGFEIFGVSFDTDKEKWLEAIEKDELTWFHVSDLKGWGNAAGKIYGVRSIPHSVLIDKEGIIVAKNLRGEELHEKLEELFNAKS